MQTHLCLSPLHNRTGSASLGLKIDAYSLLCMLYWHSCLIKTHFLMILAHGSSQVSNDDCELDWLLHHHKPTPSFFLFSYLWPAQYSSSLPADSSNLSCSSSLRSSWSSSGVITELRTQLTSSAEGHALVRSHSGSITQLQNQIYMTFSVQRKLERQACIITDLKNQLCSSETSWQTEISRQVST